MEHDSPSTLGFALLGLLRRERRSGYDLRKLFASTPIAHFSDSPGSIYPSLRRLARSGWIRPVNQKEHHARKKQRFAVTPKGLSRLNRWLRQPVRRAEVVHGMEELPLRFVFTYEFMGVPATLGFLEETEREVSAYMVELRKFLALAKPQMSMGGRLAVEQGIESYKAYIRWTRRARTELRRKQP